MNIAIRKASPDDLATIARYNQHMALETEDRDLPGEIITDGVKAVLDQPEIGQYYLASVEDQIAGQLMITREWSDWRNGWFWWIQSVYVAKEFRSRGVFSLLYQHIKQLAQNDGNVCGIRLYVENNNSRAQATYQKLGMDTTHYLLMEEEF